MPNTAEEGSRERVAEQRKWWMHPSDGFVLCVLDYSAAGVHCSEVAYMPGEVEPHRLSRSPVPTCKSTFRPREGWKIMKVHLNEVITPQQNSPSRSPSTLVVLEHNLTRSSIPLLRAMLGASLKEKRGSARALVICLLHAPSVLFAEASHDGCLRVLDLTDRVPNFGSESDATGEAPRTSSEVLTAIQEVQKQSPISVFIDSVDTLATDWGSPSQAALFLKEVHQAVSSHTAPSRLILSATARCSVLPHLLMTAFCSNLHHIILHPPLLLRHISTAFLLNPPPLTLIPKWWSVFGPFSARERGEAERLYFSPRYTSSVATEDEVVVEILSRLSGAKGVVRILEGWSPSKGPCKLEELEELKSVFANKKASVPTSMDPTQDLPFSLSLTAPQEVARSQVVLPYAHEGQPGATQAAPAIYYDPDSADDIDDDDPDDLEL